MIEIFNRKNTGKKGALQIDYVVALGLFVIMLGVLFSFTTNYVASLRETARISELRSEAASLLDSLTMRSFVPENVTFSGSSYPQRLGFATTEYKFMVLVNNTADYDSDSSPTSHVEKVVVNYTKLGFSNVNEDSTHVLDSNNQSVEYDVSGETVVFNTTSNVAINGTKWFTVYFDPNGDFTHVNPGVNGDDDITEIIYPPETLTVMQYQKMNDLNQSDYDSVKNSTAFSDNFHIRLYDTSGTLLDSILDYDASDTDSMIPDEGDVIALEKYVVYQDSTGALKNGRIVVYVW